MNTPYEELGFADDFMFGKIMSDPEICREFLERILGMEIDHVEYVETQKTMQNTADGKSIRLDIYVRGKDTVYNCEMQNSANRNLPKRARFYQGEIDMSLMERKMDYEELDDSYVIFVCPFDPFAGTPAHGNPIYRFENQLAGSGGLVVLGDGTHKIFVNTRADAAAYPEWAELFSFINFSEDREYDDPLCNRMMSRLREARTNKEWRREHMTMEMKLRDACMDARKEGHEEGHEEGLEEGREEGRVLEIIQSVKDGDYPPQRGAEKLGMPLDEFIRLMEDRVEAE